MSLEIFVTDKFNIYWKLLQINIEKNDFDKAVDYCESAMNLLDNDSHNISNDIEIRFLQSSLSLLENALAHELRIKILCRYIDAISKIPDGLAWSMQIAVTEIAKYKQAGLNSIADEVLEFAAKIAVFDDLAAAKTPHAIEIISKYGDYLFQIGDYQNSELYLSKVIDLEKK